MEISKDMTAMKLADRIYDSIWIFGIRYLVLINEIYSFIPYNVRDPDLEGSFPLSFGIQTCAERRCMKSLRREYRNG